MKNRKIIIIAAILIVIVLTVAIAFYVYSGRDTEGKKAETLIIPLGDKFQTNLKGSRSIISINMNVEIYKDKKLLQILEERNAEIRSKILDILRDKTVEDVNGKTGKQNLETQTLQYLQQSFGKEKIIGVYIDDFVVQ